MFTGQADFGGTLLTSRGQNDGFLARYHTDDGRLLAAQRMGGSGVDKWYSVAVGNNRVYAAGDFRSTNGDFPASGPGATSPFVPADPLGEVFVMQLDTAAPIVQVTTGTDVTLSPGQSATLSAIATAMPTGATIETITWYEGNSLLGSGTDFAYNTSVTDVPGLHEIRVVATDSAGRIGMAGVLVNVVAPTKFYVVDDATANQTFEYSASGAFNEVYSLAASNTAPRGAASTAAGDTTWVVDANRNVYAYNTSGGLLRSWTAGTLNSKSVVEGIATNGTDVWIVDAKTDKVYRYANGAAALSGTLTAASSFSLNSGNVSPKDIVTDGTYLWVVNDSTTDAVFKYSMTGAYQGSWTISGGGGSPTGITLDPSNASQDLWIVDSGTDNVYQYTDGRSFTSGTITATKIFDLAVGNTNPQGIADPPAPSSLLVTETPVLSEPLSAEIALGGDDVALASMYYEPLKKVRVDTAQRSESSIVETHTLDISFIVGASANRITDGSRWASDNHREAKVDDLFAQWESDPLELFSFPDLGA
ncbi:MAG: NHL repeat-containing protein [Pirellulaceae bacterium]